MICQRICRFQLIHSPYTFAEIRAPWFEWWPCIVLETGAPHKGFYCPDLAYRGAHSWYCHHSRVWYVDSPFQSVHDDDSTTCSLSGFEPNVAESASAGTSTYSAEPWVLDAALDPPLHDDDCSLSVFESDESGVGRFGNWDPVD